MKYLINNWKMNPDSLEEARNLLLATKKATGETETLKVIICPPSIFLEELQEEIDSDNFQLGAQNCHWGQDGAHTGEISAEMLHELGVKYVILGHSERAEIETEEEINKKVKSAFSAGVIPILAVGEEMRDKNNKWQDLIKERLDTRLKGIKEDEISKIIIAYEPIWAVGEKAKSAASLKEFLEAAEIIEDHLTDKYKKVEVVEQIPILYGGSIDEDNISQFAEETVDGLLVGRASLDIKMVDTIVHKFKKLCGEHGELEYE